MKIRSVKPLLAALLFPLCAGAYAEDIDLFVNTSQTSSANAPNVLFIVDNTANWNTAFTNEIAALVSTFQNLDSNMFRIGIMFAAETGNPNNNVDGGYVRAAMRLMTGDTTVAGVTVPGTGTKSKYAALIQSFDKLADKGNGGKSSLVMDEAYRYFTGGTPYAGNGKAKTDYTGNLYGSLASQAVYALSGNALPSKTANQYNSPLTGGCQKNFIIYISNGPSQDNNSVITQATNDLRSYGGDTTQITLTPSGSQDNVSDEWARFMYNSSLNVVTYTIDINPGSTGQGPGWTALLKKMANPNNETLTYSRYVAVDSTVNNGAQIYDAIQHALTEIQDVNSAFAAVSLPVSVNTQDYYLNQVYIGMFRPDASGYPRWAGNLKQYRLANTTLNTLDADGNAAINSLTGFIQSCARSYWTPTSANTDWAFKPQGTCPSPIGSATDTYTKSDYPDGNIVEKGAENYALRHSAGTRTVKTCSASACTSIIDFSNSNVSATALGVSTTTERDQLIDWEKGLDVDDENHNNVTNEIRPSAHADVVHSRPVALPYGSDVVVFYGTNDGMLHAINGNRSNAISGVAAGAELWSFVAPEFYTSIKRLRDNTTKISFPNITGGSPKPYGFDGPITAYQPSSSQAWIYATMRRGGRAIYAFDVSSPGSPSLKFKAGCPNAADDTGCTANMSGIGQTWSTPKIIKAAGYTSGPLLIMGGGYDKCEDADPSNCSSPKGRYIYVLDANDGTVKQALQTDRGVVGDVLMLTDASGNATFGYASDLGGNVYRISGASANVAIGSTAPGSWTITKIASLGCSTPATCTANRKFMFGPDVVVDNGVNILLLGSGDREKPISSYSSAYGTTDYFFMIKDTPTDANWLSTEATNCGNSSVICLNSLLGITTSANPTQAQVDAKKGWYLGLAAHEQVVTSAITSSGVVTFSTHTAVAPNSTSCQSTLGVANVYNIAYTNASSQNGTAARFQQIAGGGLPPSPSKGFVTTEDGQQQRYCIGCSGDSPLQGSPPPTVAPSGSAVQPKSRVYWYIQQ
ncbi:MAG: pilus assembly protein [Burkholderiaceae bacterium]